MPDFAALFSQLRHAAGKSQRTVAQEMHISQALLSHYENGVREPRLDFVVRACDYYGVSADYLLGRTGEKGNPGLNGADDGALAALAAGLYGLPAVRRYADGAALLLCLRAGLAAPEDAPSEALCAAAAGLWGAQALDAAAGELAPMDEATKKTLSQAAARAVRALTATLRTEEKEPI